MGLTVLLPQGSAAGEKLRVLTTFVPEYCLVVNVAGNAATVENLLPGNVSPHDYQLSHRELKKISSADIIFLNGLGVEAFLEKPLRSAGAGMKQKTVVLSDGLKEQLIAQKSEERPNQNAVTYDPHIWLDPVMAMHCVTNVVRALEKADPENAAVYRKNAEAYVARLRTLDREIAQDLAPVRESAFITYHNAFAYFVRRYHLTAAGVVETVPEVTPTPKELRRLYETVREKKVKALFTEPASSSKLARQIATDTKIKIAELDPLESGPLEAEMYEKTMRRNVQTLLETLR